MRCTKGNQKKTQTEDTTLILNIISILSRIEKFFNVITMLFRILLSESIILGTAVTLIFCNYFNFLSR